MIGENRQQAGVGLAGHHPNPHTHRHPREASRLPLSHSWHLEPFWSTEQAGTYSGPSEVRAMRKPTPNTWTPLWHDLEMTLRF